MAENPQENMAAWLLGIKNLQIQPYNLPSLGACDVRVKMKAVGICGSDVHHYKTMRCANFIVKQPMVVGHEDAGIVEEVGCEVKSLGVGDRVALEGGISCGGCRLCKEGRYNLCPEMKFFGSPPNNGCLAREVVHPASLCYKLPENVSLEGALCEPLGVGVHACRRASIGPETSVLIMGCGPIGLVTMLVARAFGAPRVVVADVDDHRLCIAKALGAHRTVRVSTDIQDIDEVETIKNAMGDEINVTFDCVGVSKTMATAIKATSSGGKVCLIGLACAEMTVPLTLAAAREVDVIGIFRYCNTWPLCIELLRTGKVDIKPLITHRFGFSEEEIAQAFETSARGSDAIKVMFNM